MMRTAKQFYAPAIALLLSTLHGCGPSTASQASLTPHAADAAASQAATAAVQSAAGGTTTGANASASNSASTSTDTGAASGSTASGTGSGSATAAIALVTVPPFACNGKKTSQQYLTTMVQDLFRREPTPAEIAMAATYTPQQAVDWAMAQPDLQTGIAYFVSNLLRLQQNLVIAAGAKTPTPLQLDDLKQEPVILVQQNLNNPWSNVFTTTKFFCSANTAPLYGLPFDPNISGFAACNLPPERAGILGLVSTLQAFPSSFFGTNSNRHRVALAVYLAQGLQLQANTAGPTGTGAGIPLASCVPSIDQRKTTSGEIFGTAAVPAEGSVCASCHSPYLAPMEIGFMKFGLMGETLTTQSIAALTQTQTQGVPVATLQSIFAQQNSCWSPDTTTGTPVNFTGLPGLAGLIAGSPNLAKALAIQIQQNLVNDAPNDNITANIVNAYNQNGQTLKSALQGFFLSDGYQCESPVTPITAASTGTTATSTAAGTAAAK